MENMVAWEEILLYGFMGVLFTIILISMFYGSKKTKKRLEVITAQLEKSMSEYAQFVEGPLKLQSENYEFRCKPKDPNIGVLTVNYQLISEGFPNNLINLFSKPKEKFFIGAKFRTGGRDINPVYTFDLIPYREKNLIRKNFEEFITMEDIPTTNSYIDQNFMIKSKNERMVEHFVRNHEFQEFTQDYHENIKFLNLKPSKEKQTPHMQLTSLILRTETAKITKIVKYFFLIAGLHIQNNEKVQKLLTKQKSKSILKRTKSAKMKPKTQSLKRKKKT